MESSEEKKMNETKSKFLTPEMQEIERLENDKKSIMEHLMIISEENSKLREENVAMKKLFDMLDIKDMLEKRK